MSKVLPGIQIHWGKKKNLFISHSNLTKWPVFYLANLILSENFTQMEETHLFSLSSALLLLLFFFFVLYSLIILWIFFHLFLFSSVQSLSRIWLFVIPWIAAHQASLSITNSRSLFKLMSIESVMPSSHLIPLSSPSPPAPNSSQHQGLFQWVNSSHEVTKILEFQL